MKTKKITALLLALALAFTLAPPALASGAPFADVPSSHWAYSEIMEAYADGAVNGTSANTYNPNGNVTMAQFIAILTRAFFPEDVENVTSSVAYYHPGYSWYEPNYSIATDLGLFQNVPDTSPNTEVTREIMAQIMYNLMSAELTGEQLGGSLGADAVSAAKQKIPDFASVSPSYGNAAAACYGLGLIAGTDSSGSFSPKGRMNRAQTAVIYVRLKQAIWELSGAADWERENGTSTGAVPSANPGTQQPNTTAALANGKPATEENVLALIEEYKNGTRLPGEKARAAGFTSYVSGSYYDAYNPKYNRTPFGGGTECAKFAFAFWDDLFGNLPAREFTDINSVRPGDLIHWDTHWGIAVSHAFLDKPGTPWEHVSVWDVGGGSAGSISWSTIPDWLDAGDLVAIYTRYPG